MSHESALAWTRRAADREHYFAETLVQRTRAVFAALDTGRIDRAKAWIFTDFCAELRTEHTEVVCQRLLPQAGRLTTGESAARIKKIAVVLDPDWAARRYALAVRERNVIGYLNDDGTATVTGSHLPTDQAAAACARIEDLAKAAKRAGHPGRVGHLRAAAGSSNCTSLKACSPGSPRTRLVVASGPVSSQTSPTRTCTACRPRKILPPGSPARRYADTSSCGIGLVSSWGAGAQPGS